MVHHFQFPINWLKLSYLQPNSSDLFNYGHLF